MCDSVSTAYSVKAQACYSVGFEPTTFEFSGEVSLTRIRMVLLLLIDAI